MIIIRAEHTLLTRDLEYRIPRLHYPVNSQRFPEVFGDYGTILVTIEIEAFSLKISIDDEHAVELSCIWIVLGRL